MTSVLIFQNAKIRNAVLLPKQIRVSKQFCNRKNRRKEDLIKGERCHHRTSCYPSLRFRIAGGFRTIIFFIGFGHYGDCSQVFKELDGSFRYWIFF
ncbi:MAG: hypothetical protein B6D37_14980 [Sphingobacteriales bacterium UTBCD1]|nr:MAG: hypothetical protein B6D37_14980 [Sphingobacteriales bacterium UTBCD1]